MESVVLAAGAGERLNGFAAPFHKPLMVVNGKPLIVQAVQAALQACEDGACHVVVAPSNAGAIIDLLEANRLLSYCRFVVQARPTGPGHAFLEAAIAIHSEKTLILMGDNILTSEDVLNVVNDSEGSPITMGVQAIDSWQQACRFTRVWEDGSIHEWPQEQTGDRWSSTRQYMVWCGPLVVDTQRLIKVLSLDAKPTGDKQELKLGQWLGDLGKPILVPVTSVDVGLPEALT